MYSPRWPKRKLTETDGERILLHMREHLMHDKNFWHEDYYLGIEKALDTIRNLLVQFS